MLGEFLVVKKSSVLILYLPVDFLTTFDKRLLKEKSRDILLCRLSKVEEMKVVNNPIYQLAISGTKLWISLFHKPYWIDKLYFINFINFICRNFIYKESLRSINWLSRDNKYEFILFPKTWLKKTLFFWKYLARKMFDRIWSILSKFFFPT